MNLLHFFIHISLVLTLFFQDLPALDNSIETSDLNEVLTKIAHAQELQKLGLSKREILEHCSNLLKEELAAEQNNQEENDSNLLLYTCIGIATVVVISVGGFIYWFASSKDQNPHHKNDESAHHAADNCAFCQIINNEAPAVVIDETDTMIAIEKRPVRRPTDCLIIPKRHIENIRTIDYSNPIEQQTLADVGQMAQRLSERLNGNGHFTLSMNNGRESNQTVFHLHAHFRSPNVWK